MKAVHFVLLAGGALAACLLWNNLAIAPRMDQAAAEAVGGGFVSREEDLSRWQQSGQAMIAARPVSEMWREGLFVAGSVAAVMILVNRRRR